MEWSLLSQLSEVDDTADVETNSTDGHEQHADPLHQNV